MFSISNTLSKVTKIRRAKDPTRPEAKLCGGPTVGRPLCSGKKKEEEHIFCPGCDDQYEEPITEGWIKYVKFRRWGSDLCAFEGDLTIKCDICYVR